MENLNITYLSTFNKGYSDFAINNIINYIKIIKSPSNKLLLSAMDEESYHIIKDFLSSNHLENEQINVIKNFDKYVDFADFNTKEFISLTHNKIHFIFKELLNSKVIHYFDADVFFFKDPSDLIKEELRYHDIVFQQDAPVVHHNNRYHNYVCTGNFSLKKNDRTIFFMREIINNLNIFQNDQEIVFNYLNSKCKNIKEYENCKLHAYDQKLFQNGYDSFTENWYNFSEKISIHANHMVGKDNKINSLKKAEAWYNGVI